MYAVIKTGGKQYRVSEGQTLRVEKLPGAPGDKVSFDEVLMVSGDAIKIGQPLVSGASVNATIVAQDKAKKVIVFKFKRRKNYRRKQGHRQLFTELRVDGIALAPPFFRGDYRKWLTKKVLARPATVVTPTPSVVA